MPVFIDLRSSVIGGVIGNLGNVRTVVEKNLIVRTVVTVPYDLPVVIERSIPFIVVIVSQPAHDVVLCRTQSQGGDQGNCRYHDCT